MNNQTKTAELQEISTTSKQEYSNKQLAKFLIPTLLGILLFLTPIYIDGRMTIMIALMIDFVNDFTKPIMVPVAVAVTVFPSILSLIVKYSSLKNNSNAFIQVFNPTNGWLITRILGAIVMMMVYLQIGPEWIWHRNTGGVILHDIAPILIAIYFISAILLPLLTEFGLMEFVGTFFNRVFQKLFGLPGSAAVDSIASWLSATSVGIILTTQQYKNGFYSSREACVIATNFSIVSVGYAYFLLKLIGLQDMFISWYFSVAITGIICAIILPKLPPLCFKKHSYHTGEKNQLATETITDEPLFQQAISKAINRAEKAESPQVLVRNSFLVAFDLAISMYPAIMLVGALGLALIEFTPIFQILSQPLVPLLELLQLPEAEKASVALLAGVIDSIMPTILGASIESELTRFVLAGVAVTQIVFLSEVALVLMRAGIGLKLADILLIYVMRVLISLPILTLFAHLFVG